MTGADNDFVFEDHSGNLFGAVQHVDSFNMESSFIEDPIGSPENFSQCSCDQFVFKEQPCDLFDLVQFVETFDMGINFLEGPPGPPGPAGEAIFIPSVSEDGWISWTNTAGLPNPDPVYIKGPPGGGGSGDYADLTNKPSINGVTLSGNKTTADLLIAFTAADVGLGNVANERQYSAQNPPPYPVTSVNGQTGVVSIPLVSAIRADNQGGGGTGVNTGVVSLVGLGCLVYTVYPGRIEIQVSKHTISLGNVANVLQYSAENPPPYPVTSVNGMRGDVVVSNVAGTGVDVVATHSRK